MKSPLLALLLLVACDYGLFSPKGERIQTPRPAEPPIAVTEPAFLVIRPVSQTRTPGSSNVTSVQGQTLYFSSSTLMDLSHFDVRTAESVTPEGTHTPTHAISLRTTPAGRRILSDWTEQNIGSQLGIFLDGRLISAPFIRSRIDDMIVLEGDFTAEEAAAIVARFRRRGAA